MAADNLCPICEAPVRLENTKPLRKSEDILPHLNHFRNKQQEFFICISLDGALRPIARRVVTIGTLNSTLVHPREVFAGPITDRATAIIIAHNHPSGDAEPSKADIATTQQLAAAGQILGIKLRDHIIVTSQSFHSFNMDGLL